MQAAFEGLRARSRAHGETRAIARHTLEWLLESAARLAGLPFDRHLVGARYPAEVTVADCADALTSLGCTVERVDRRRLGNALRRRVGVAVVWAVSAESQDLEPRLAIRAGGERWGVFTPAANEAASVHCDELASADTCWFLTLPSRAQDSAEADDDPAHEPRATAARFGFHSLWPLLRRHRSIWRDVLAASFAIQVVGLATPLLTQVIIDKVLVHRTMSTLIVVALALALSIAFNASMSWVRQYLLIHTGSRVDAVFGQNVFAHLLRLPPRYVERRQTGTIIARLQGVETIREFITGAAIAVLLDLPFLFVFVAIMFAYSWELSLLALGFTLVIAGLSAVVTPALRRRLDEQFLRGAKTQAFTTEYVAGFETVKSLQLEPVLERRYGELLADAVRSSRDTRQFGNAFGTVSGALEQTMSISILLVGALIVMRENGFSVGMLIAFQMFASRMSQPLMRLVGLWQEFQQAAIAVKRLGDLVDAPTEPYSIVPSRVAASGAAQVEVESLGFRFGPNHPWLFREFTLRLAPGKTTVLTGASGSGKSTLAKLLLGFHQPLEGRIRLDGNDIAFLAANELRASFGVVPQETVLFNGTIYDNLQLANPDATFEEIVDVCRLAEVHAAIEALPQGYQTRLGEHGTGLSGGQRQRIAIARALLRRPRILIFDEATSSLDPPTAEALARTVNKLRGSATILFIAHHVPRALQIDQIARIGEPTGTKPAPSSTIVGGVT